MSEEQNKFAALAAIQKSAEASGILQGRRACAEEALAKNPHVASVMLTWLALTVCFCVLFAGVGCAVAAIAMLPTMTGWHAVNQAVYALFFVGSFLATMLLVAWGLCKKSAIENYLSRELTTPRGG